MRRVEPTRPTIDDAYTDMLGGLAAPYGVHHTGVAPAAVLLRARAELLRRRDAGLADGMQFTYRSPERSTDPGAAVRGARAVFVGAKPYWTPDPDASAPSGPVGRIARYARADYYGELRDGLWEVARRLRRDGWKAVVFADDNSIVDREVAYLAGIGWFGKSANLLVPGGGSWFVLGCVVTDAPLPVATTTVADGCGACRRCIDHCPTGAIVAAGVVDARRCLSWVLQKPGSIPQHLRVPIGDRLYGCDECQDACPPSIRFSPQAWPRSPADRQPQATVSLLDLLRAEDAGVLAIWGRWYLADRDPRWARRNALVVLGNVGDPTDPDVLAILAAYAAHSDPLLCEHARWAIARLHDRTSTDAMTADGAGL